MIDPEVEPETMIDERTRENAAEREREEMYAASVARDAKARREEWEVD